MKVVRILLVAFAIAAVLGIAASAGASERTTALLRLDGVQFRPEVAKTPAQRSKGLMNRTQAPKDGMLFVFPGTTTGGFWMKNTLVPLRIVFFDFKGRAVRTLRMTPCLEDPCALYRPRRPYRFALELPASDPRRAEMLDPPAALLRLIRVAS